MKKVSYFFDFVLDKREPKGSILVECGEMLKKGRPLKNPKMKNGEPIKDKNGNFIMEQVKDKNGKDVYEPYNIKVLNTIDLKQSMKYNPFAYIKNEPDILKLVTTFITNTSGEQKGGDEFWTKAETLLYTALIGYIVYECPPSDHNFRSLCNMINEMEVREDDETFKNPIDLLFEDLEETSPTHFAVRQYKKYKLAAGVVECKSNLYHAPLKGIA